MNKGMAKIKEFLFNALFQKEKGDLQSLELSNKELRAKLFELRKELQRATEEPKPDLGDLMRKNLATITLDLADLDKSGNPAHYLSGLDEKSKEAWYARLSSIYTSPEFKAMCKYLINCQANLTVRKGLTDRQNDAGRFTINGISLILEELERNHMLYEEATKPPDSYDRYEVV